MLKKKVDPPTHYKDTRYTHTHTHWGENQWTRRKPRRYSHSGPEQSQDQNLLKHPLSIYQPSVSEQGEIWSNDEKEEKKEEGVVVNEREFEWRAARRLYERGSESEPESTCWDSHLCGRMSQDIGSVCTSWNRQKSKLWEFPFWTLFLSIHNPEFTPLNLRKKRAALWVNLAILA